MEGLFEIWTRNTIFLRVSQYVIRLADYIADDLNSTKYIKYLPIPILKELQI